jgi:hypothetical protein
MIKILMAMIVSAAAWLFPPQATETADGTGGNVPYNALCGPGSGTPYSVGTPLPPPPLRDVV